MLNVCTKGILVCYTLVSFKFNGVFDFAVIVLIFRCVNHEEVGTVSVAVARLNCPGFTYITLRYKASVTGNQWGDRIQIFKVLPLLEYC